MEPRFHPTVASDNEDKKYLMTLSVTELISNLRTPLGLVDYDRVKEVLEEKESKLKAQITELRIKNAKLDDEKSSAESDAEYWKGEYKELIQLLIVQNGGNLFVDGDNHVGIVGNSKKQSSSIGGNTHLGVPDKLISEKDSPNKAFPGASANGCSTSRITVIGIEDSDDDDDDCVTSPCSNRKKEAARETAAAVDDNGHLIILDQLEPQPKIKAEPFKRKWLPKIANLIDGCDIGRGNNTDPRIPDKLIGEKDLNVVNICNNNERGSTAAGSSPSQRKGLKFGNTPNFAVAAEVTRQSQDSPNRAFLGVSANGCSTSRITVIGIEDSDDDDDDCVTSPCSNRKKEAARETAAAVDDNGHLILLDQSQHQPKSKAEPCKRKWLPEIANLMDSCDTESSTCDKRRRKT